MNNKQKGSVPLLLVGIIALLVIAGSVSYFELSNKTGVSKDIGLISNATSTVDQYKNPITTSNENSTAPIDSNLYMYEGKALSIKDLPDDVLLANAYANKDVKWCEYIRDGQKKQDCAFSVEGPKIVKIPFDFKTMPTAGRNYKGALLITEKQKGSIAWISTGLDLERGVYSLNVKAEIKNSSIAQALLTAYFDDGEIGQVDGRDILSGVQDYDFAFVNATTGPHSIGFRLDTFAEGGSEVDLSNIKLDYITNASFTD